LARRCPVLSVARPHNFASSHAVGLIVWSRRPDDSSADFAD